jgi:hypothetical protein
MRSQFAHRGFALADALIVLAAIVVIATSGSTDLIEPVALQFLLALVLINLLDIVLPHGDSVDLDSALVIAALCLLGPITALLVSLLARTTARFLSVGLRNPRALLAGLAKRIAGFSLAVPVWLLVSPGAASGSAAEYTAILLAGVTYVIAELIYGQIGMALLRADSLVRMTLSNLALQGPFLASSVSVAILTVMVYDSMMIWGLALMGFLLLAMRQSFALLLDVRSAYHATVEALIGAMEAQRPGEQGTGERVAVLARMVGAEYGWFGSRVETLGYAALLHYFGLEFQQADAATGTERPTPLSEVRFFTPVEPIVRLLGGRSVDQPGSYDTAAAYIVALSLASVDAETGSRTVECVRPMVDPRVADKVEQALRRAKEKAENA